jgi:hypothetical protein
MKTKRVRKSAASAQPHHEEDRTEVDAQSAEHANGENPLVEHNATKRRSKGTRKSAAADATITTDGAEDGSIDQNGTAPTEAQSGRKPRTKRMRKSDPNTAPIPTENNDVVNDTDMAEVDAAATGPEPSATGADASQKRKRKSLRSATAVFADLDRSLDDTAETPDGESTERRDKRVSKSRISGTAAGGVDYGAQHATENTQADDAPSKDTTLVNDMSVAGQTDRNRRKSNKRKSTALLVKDMDMAATGPDDTDEFVLEHEHDSAPSVGSPPRKATKPRKSQKSGGPDQSVLDRNGQISPPPRTELVSSGAKKTGLWSAEEKERLDAAINSYGHRHGLTKLDLVGLIQYTIPTVYSDAAEVQFDVEATIRAKTAVREFWSEIHQLFPDRTTTSIHRIARRRWHNYENRGGNWSPDEDRLLTELNKLHPNQWKIISLSVKRSPEDCRDRWRNYLQYGDNRNTHHWTDDEVSRLNQAVLECIQSLLEDQIQSKGSVDGYDPYIDLDWHVVSQKAGGTRSRLQCLSKWKALQAASAEMNADASTALPSSAGRLPPKPPARNRTSVSAQGARGKATMGAKMLTGDRFQLIQDIANANVPKEAEIPWDKITRANPDSPWTSDDRKEAFEALVNEVGRRKVLDDTLMAILETFTGEEMEEFYVPGQSGSDGQVASSQPTSSRKRNRKPRASEPTKRFKSAHLITASDDEAA